jgi:hypothetical protein
MHTKRFYILLAILVAASLALAFKASLKKLAQQAGIGLPNSKTIEQRLDQYGAAARARLQPYFQKANVSYPPKGLTFVGLKAEHELLIYARAEQGTNQFVRSYPILAASGVPGPKLREGDEMVPEGVYPIELLNPNSLYHLSLRIGYPDAFDREQARQEGRTNLGGDIMIHGGAVSLGCLAIGDEAVEEVFVLAADCGIENITVILSPVDFRLGRQVPVAAKLPEWSREVHQQIRARLNELPLPAEP